MISVLALYCLPCLSALLDYEFMCVHCKEAKGCCRALRDLRVVQPSLRGPSLCKCQVCSACILS